MLEFFCLSEISSTFSLFFNYFFFPLLVCLLVLQGKQNTQHGFWGVLGNVQMCVLKVSVHLKFVQHVTKATLLYILLAALQRGVQRTM